MLKQHIPKLHKEDIAENHRIYKQRRKLYKKEGLYADKIRKYILEKARPVNGNILEIGTGYGNTTIIIAKEGYRVSTIDSDENILNIAALNVAHEGILDKVIFYVMDGCSMGFNNFSFNNIVSVNFIHHIKKIEELLEEMNRVLVPGGKIILADFNEKGINIVEKVHVDEKRTHENYGLRTEQIYSHLKKKGYKIKKYRKKYIWIFIAVKPDIVSITRELEHQYIYSIV